MVASLSFYKRISYLCQGVTKERKSDMNAIDLNAYRNELAREILSTDDMEALQSVYRAYQRAVNKINGYDRGEISKEEDKYPMQCSEGATPYLSQVELDADIEAAINDENAKETEVKRFYERWSS